MKRITITLAALAIAVAACTSGASQVASPADDGAAATEVAAAASPLPTPAPEWLEVSVTFDGTTCDYRGPTVVPRGQLAKFSFANIGPAATDGRLAAILVVGPVLAGTTWDKIIDDTTPASELPPAWADPDGNNVIWFQKGDGTRETQLTGHLYVVACLTAPEPVGNDTVYPAALVHTLGE
jgi:hypothetical protein